MNREVLFRGLRPDENGKVTITLNGKKIKGEWVYGAYDFNKENKKGFIVCVGIDNIGAIAYIQEVIPETVGQYTDLTDKNGNKIFEGDIVKLTDEVVDMTYMARVEFGNPNGLYNWGFQLVPMCKTPFAVEILHWCDMEESGAFIKIIGNIYEEVEQ